MKCALLIGAGLSLGLMVLVAFSLIASVLS
jgi:hypothetical protein